MASRRPILVVGGGIAGLALALSLARQGRASIVLESRPHFQSPGAGIQLGANAVRVLAHLGLAERLRPRVGTPDRLTVFDGHSARRLAELPLGAWLARRHGAPYWTMHRSDLMETLVRAAAAEPRIELRAGYAFASAHEEAGRVRAHDAAGQGVDGEALIGADGLWSAVRQAICPAATPRFAGSTAMRAVIPAAAAGRLAATDVGLWLGAGANVVHYPVRAGTEIAIVVIAREAWPAGGGDVAVAGARALSVLAAFHPALTEALAAAPEWRKWSLHLLAKRPRWCMGRIGLIGDAAHPMLPHLAQGGALALEDALVLGALLGEEGADVAASFRRFEAERRGRAQSIAAHSHRNGVIYHLGPPLAWARNGVLRLLPGAWLMAGYDLIYGWRPNGRGTARWQQTVSGL